MEPIPNADETTLPVTPDRPSDAAPTSPDHSDPPPNDVADVPPDATPAAEAPGDEAVAEDVDPLERLVAASQRGRLPQADEDRAAELTRELLLSGRNGVARAIELLPRMPWVIGVNGVTAAWLEMKPIFRRQLLAGLARVDSDAARRVRLSLARGLFKLDVATALKIALGVAKEMRDKETGGLSVKNAQILANVFIGRAKPWIGQLPLASLKPGEADLLVHAALLTVFTLPHAPVTQLGIIKWAAEAGRLAKLHPAALAALTNGIGRWGGKWQSALRKEVAELPEEIAVALKRDASTEERPPQRPEREEQAGDVTDTVAADTTERSSEAQSEDRDEEEEDDEEDAERARPPAPKQRPVYESKTVPAQHQRRGQQASQSAHFNLNESLRQIEAHVSGLRSELHTAQAKLRQRDDDSRRAPRRSVDRAAVPIIEGEPTPDELARLNRQLESRNAELQQRIDDLTADSEDRAASMGAHGGEPVANPDAQLRALLALKLQEDHADFEALEKEAPDIVVQQHYRTVLRHVFEVLRQEGVEFAAIPEEP